MAVHHSGRSSRTARNTQAQCASVADGRIPIRIHLPPLDPDQVKQYVRQPHDNSRLPARGVRR